MDNMKHNNICIMGIIDGKESENLSEEIMTENFPNLVKEKDTQVQETKSVPNKLNSKRPTPRHTIIKDKERILKATRKKQLPTRELP